MVRPAASVRLHERLGIAEADSWVAEGALEGVVWGQGFVSWFVSLGRPFCVGGRCKAWCVLMHVFMFVPERAGRSGWRGRAEWSGAWPGSDARPGVGARGGDWGVVVVMLECVASCCLW